MVHCGPWTRGPYVSVQVNNDGKGCNMVGDAANEPSIAIDPIDPSRIVIGWRQFDSVLSDYRKSAYAYSRDAGETWLFPGLTLGGNVFGTDPVLAAASDGSFYYLSLQPDRGPGDWACYLYRSFDGGATWPQEEYAYGGDKAWMTVDGTGGVGDGRLYLTWQPDFSCCGTNIFTGSSDGGISFPSPAVLPGSPRIGTVAVGVDGEVYVSSITGQVARSNPAEEIDNPIAALAFHDLYEVDLGGEPRPSLGKEDPNPAGLAGQNWVACDHSVGSFRGLVYMLATVQPAQSSDPLDIVFARSASRGAHWSPPLRVNDDDATSGAFQWFGTLSVAPNGRIDVVWNDTRNSADHRFSGLYYSASVDAGRTWSPNVPVSPMFNSWLGWPQQGKIGDYYHSISDAGGVNVAYAATFNGEQDVYFLRIPADCDADGITDALAIAEGGAPDLNSNTIPDGCESDTDRDGLFDMDDFDMDGDGVVNSSDRCPFGPIGFRYATDGRAFGDDDGNCRIDLADHQNWSTTYACFDTSGPGLRSPSRRCRDGLDFDADGDIDLIDVAAYQRIFGRYGG